MCKAVGGSAIKLQNVVWWGVGSPVCGEAVYCTFGANCTQTAYCDHVVTETNCI